VLHPTEPAPCPGSRVPAKATLIPFLVTSSFLPGAIAGVSLLLHLAFTDAICDLEHELSWFQEQVHRYHRNHVPDDTMTFIDEIESIIGHSDTKIRLECNLT
jgi:hypothetical protein